MTIPKSGQTAPKPYKFIDPNGQIHIGENVREFARKMGLDAANMAHVYLGERSHHKGWRLAEPF